MLCSPLWYGVPLAQKRVHRVHCVYRSLAAYALASLAALGIEVQTDGERLRWRPVEAIGPETKADILVDRDSFVAELKVSVEALAAAEAVIDAALPNLTPTQRNVAEAFRAMARTHASNYDPLLVGDAEFINGEFTKWRGQR